MGTIQHDAVLVTTYRTVEMKTAVEAFRAQLQDADPRFAKLLFGPIPGVINGYETWGLAPDGSKEYWADSERGDWVRAAFIHAVLEADEYARVVRVSYGEIGNTVLVGGG